MHLHMLNDNSRGYFQQAICQSGTSLNYFAISDYKNHLGRMFEFAKNVTGKAISNVNDLVKFLQEVPIDKIIEYAHTKLGPYGRTLVSDWAPLIEGK